ncbi:MAG: transposase family protein [Chloroflexota bacterium]
MPISTPAQISFPLDIPQVDVLATEQTRDGKFIITVESRRDTTRCGVCKQEIACKYGHGQIVRLRHLPILGQETYIEIRPRRAQCTTCQRTTDNGLTLPGMTTQPPYQSIREVPDETACPAARWRMSASGKPGLRCRSGGIGAASGG